MTPCPPKETVNPISSHECLWEASGFIFLWVLGFFCSPSMVKSHCSGLAMPPFGLSRLKFPILTFMPFSSCSGFEAQVPLRWPQRQTPPRHRVPRWQTGSQNVVICYSSLISSITLFKAVLLPFSFCYLVVCVGRLASSWQRVLWCVARSAEVWRGGEFCKV